MKNYQTAKPKPKSFGAIVGTPAPAAPSAAASGAAEKKAEKAARCAALASAGTRKAEKKLSWQTARAHISLLLRTKQRTSLSLR